MKFPFHEISFHEISSLAKILWIIASRVGKKKFENGNQKHIFFNKLPEVPSFLERSSKNCSNSEGGAKGWSDPHSGWKFPGSARPG